MHGHLTPLVLVVCDDAERVCRLRIELRRSGFLPALAHSPAMASALFTQIRIEAVVVCAGDALGQIDVLYETVRERDALPVFMLGAAAPLPGWTACTEEDLLEQLRAVFTEGPGSDPPI